MKRSGFKRSPYAYEPPSILTPIRRSCNFSNQHVFVSIPKSPRYADRHLLDMARGQSCLLQSPICNHNCETVVACHGSGLANGKGMGLKVGDHLVVYGCSDCNHYTDAYGGATAAEKRAVFESGHARQIKLWMAIRDNANAPKKDRESARNALLQQCD